MEQNKKKIARVAEPGQLRGSKRRIFALCATLKIASSALGRRGHRERFRQRKNDRVSRPLGVRGFKSHPSHFPDNPDRM
jgi:hypothetical protein